MSRCGRYRSWWLFFGLMLCVYSLSESEDVFACQDLPLGQYPFHTAMVGNTSDKLTSTSNNYDEGTSYLRLYCPLWCMIRSLPGIEKVEI